MLIYGSMSSRGLMRHHIRQGLDLSLDSSVTESMAFDGASASNNQGYVRVSPDQTRVMFAGGSNTSNLLFTWPDSSDPTTNVRPIATFANTIGAAACSNTHYAVGGPTPFLYVFDWATHSLVSVSTTGLGTVNALAFSPDGSKLAVAHTTAPFLRVYDTTAWTYVDAVTSAGVARASVEWSSDGTLVFGQGTSNPQFTVYSANLATRHVATNDGNRTVSGTPCMIRHPTKPKAIIATAGGSATSAVHKLWEYDYATTTFTNFVAGGSTTIVHQVVYDPTNNVLYATSNDATKKIRKFNISTYAEITGEEKAINHLAALISNTYSPYWSLATLRRSLGQITGMVRDITNTPNDREVDAYRRSDGILMARTMSDGTTGNYTLNLPDTADYDVQFKIESGELLNDLFFARAVPAAV